MVLFCVVGEMGAGKTLTATHLAFKNWYFRKMKIFSNYHLFQIPYYYIETVSQLLEMRDGVAVLDELWRICDARMSRSSKNQFVGDILARSRKRHLVYLFTAQVIDTIDRRIRKVQDFTAYPILNRTETFCKVTIFRTGYPKEANYMKTIYFDTAIPMQCYDTDEEVDMVDDLKDEVRKPPQLMFQEKYNPEHGYGCQCEECKTKFFKTWEEADKYGEEYWKKKFHEILKENK